MKKLYKLLFVTGILTASPLALAQDKAGNGGNTVVCSNSSGTVTSVELLDYYEARVQRKNIKVDFGSSAQTFEQSMEVLLSRLQQKNPSRAAKYRKWYAQFFDEANLIPGIGLVEVNDSHHMVVPNGCKVVQTIVQKRPDFPEDSRYTVNKDVWDLLDAQVKAGLVFHELIYRETSEAAYPNEVKNSTVVRYLNSLIAADLLRNIKLYTYYNLLRELGFRDMDVSGYHAHFNFLSFVGDRISFVPDSDSKITLKFQGKNVDVIGRVDIDEAGNLYKFETVESTPVQTPGGTIMAPPKTLIDITTTGFLEKITIAEDTKLKLKSGQEINCEKNIPINFYPTSGYVSECVVVVKDLHLLSANYDLRSARADNVNMHFSPEGYYMYVIYEWYYSILIRYGYMEGKILIGQNWVDVRKPEYDEISKLLSAEFLKPVLLKNFNSQKEFYGLVLFDLNENVVAGTLAANMDYAVQNNKVVFAKDTHIKFDPTGLVTRGTPTGNFQWNFNGQTLNLLGENYKCSWLGTEKELRSINFGKNGNLIQAQLASDQTINSDGQILHGKKGDILEVTQFEPTVKFKLTSMCE